MTRVWVEEAEYDEYGVFEIGDRQLSPTFQMWMQWCLLKPIWSSQLFFIILDIRWRWRNCVERLHHISWNGAISAVELHAKIDNGWREV